MAQVRTLVPETAGRELELVGHVTPAAPLDGPQGYRLGLQIGRGTSAIAQSDGYLRWDPANDRLSLSASNDYEINPTNGPYAGLLFTIQGKKRYITLCNGTGNDVEFGWFLDLGPTYPKQQDKAKMQAGTLIFVTKPISGDGGYANLSFGFKSQITLSECWMFSFQTKS